MSDKQTKRVVGVGSALIDILINGTDDFIGKIGAVKGGMTLVDDAVIEKALAMHDSDLSIVPGGSACNTVTGIGKLGGQARFIGKCGNDEMGDLFKAGLKKNNVQPALAVSSSPTGRVLSVITPDAQRSMLTSLGASAEADPREMTPDLFENAAIVHLEGYLMFNPELIQSVLDQAVAAGARVSLDLASFTIIDDHFDRLRKIVDDYVDILMANEDEARAFTGCSDESQAMKILGQKADIAVLKVGERGSFISHDGKIIPIEPAGSGGIIDTTGAGDLWAGGFLYGLVNGLPIETCGAIGSRCGFEVCKTVGAVIPDDRWEKIRELVA